MKAKTKNLIDRIVVHYLGSANFNGLPVRTIGPESPETRAVIANLIVSRVADLIRGDMHPNPHIKAFEAEAAEEQLRKLNTEGIGNGCLYPTRELLTKVEAGRGLDGKPFSKALALGAAQLDFRAFDLRVLEWYRNDPRYEYRVDDIHGSIVLKAEQERTEKNTVKDSLELFRFGFAYDEDMKRAIAVFLRDLSGLSAEHQLLLQTYLVNGEYSLHPGFHQSTILGNFPDRISIYDAFLEEKGNINAICKLMGKPGLFKTEHYSDARPAGFGIMLRPTRKEFRDFALLLDQLLSEDINRYFFKGDIPVTENLTRDDGSKVTQSIGTISLLQKWLEKNFKPADPDDLKLLAKKIREVRTTRQKPAHVAEDNEFDQKFLHEQRELIKSAFYVVRTLRMILENHPKAAGYEISDWLRNAKVWVM